MLKRTACPKRQIWKNFPYEVGVWEYREKKNKTIMNAHHLLQI